MKHLSLRLKLIVFVVLITGAALFLAGISNYNFAKQSALESIKESANELVQSRSDHLSLWINTRLTEAEIMSRSEQVRNGTEAERLAYFRKEIERSKGVYSSIGFADRNGNLRLSSGEMMPIRSEASFDQVMRGERVISDPFNGKATNERLFTIQVPVYDGDNEIIGLVHASILADAAFKSIKDFQWNHTGTVWVAAADGSVLYLKAAAGAASVKPAAASSLLGEIVGDLKQSPHGFREFSRDKERLALSYSAVEGTGWLVALELSIDEVEKPMASLLWKTILTIAATETVMIGLLILIYNRQIIRIREILSVTETVAEGNFDLPPIPISHYDEIGAMTQSVNGMMVHLKVLFERLDTIINQNEFMMMGLDSNYVITYFSKTAESMLGYKAEEVVNKATPLLFIAPEQIVEEAERLTKLLGRTVVPGLEVLHELRTLQFSYDREWTFVRKDGMRIPVAHNSNGLLDDEGRFMGVVAIARDITEQKQVRQELVHAKQAAEEANLAKGRFLASMSHEIRTPLNGIIGLTQLMQKTEMTEVQKDYSSKVLYSSQALLRIINDILDFSKMEAGKLEVERVTFRPEELMNRLSGILSVFLGDKEQFELLIETDESLPYELIGDPLRLEQVLLNLCSNAVKFTEKGLVKIKVEVVQELDSSVIVGFKVEDTGIGISSEQMDHLFKPFTQADGSTSRKYGGTGLGLVIASSLIELMGGRMEVHSELGEGSVFSFTLPFMAPSEIVPSRIMPSRIMPDGSTSKGSLSNGNGSGRMSWKLNTQNQSLRVMVVEDHPDMRQHISSLLRSFSLEPVLFSSWKEAYAELKRHSAGHLYDVALLDMESPDMYGLETWEAFKQKALAAGVITLALTTVYGRDEMLSMSPENRPEGIVVKPFSRISLRQAIDAAWNQSVRSSDPSLAAKRKPSRRLAGGGRILLAEDNAINQQVAVELLTQRGYSVEVAENGYEVLLKLEAEDWDMILMDIYMPKMDGTETTRRIRQGDRLRDIPIIALTANVVSNDHEQYLSAGMNDILTKPIDLQEMDAVMHKWLKEAASEAAAAYYGEDFQSGYGQSAGSSILQKLSGSSSINVNKALDQLLGKENILLKMIEIFLRDYVGFAERIRAAVQEDELQAAERFAHTLKGASASLSAEPLYKSAAKLEICLRAAQPSAKTGHPAVHGLDAEAAADVTGAANMSTATDRQELEAAMGEVEQCLERLLAAFKGLS